MSEVNVNDKEFEKDLKDAQTKVRKMMNQAKISAEEIADNLGEKKQPKEQEATKNYETVNTSELQKDVKNAEERVKEMMKEASQAAEEI